MLILVPEPKSKPAPVAGKRIFSIFGVGLIGSALEKAIQRIIPCNPEYYSLAWDDPYQQMTDLELIRERLIAGLEEKAATLSESSPASLCIVWSAGRAGFSASKAAVDAELRSYYRVLALAEKLALQHHEARVDFFMLGSAGGLFEGQRNVGKESLPAPLRPYGAGKLLQERKLRDSSAPLCKRIYRLTSVFGYLRADRRRGLIPSMIANGIRKRVTSITADMTTLRDFTWVEDVADFIAWEMLHCSGSPEFARYLLASAKPSSVYEIKNLVERVCGLRLLVSYTPGNHSNRRDITFTDDAVPDSWTSSTLGTNIKKVYQDALSRGWVWGKVESR